MPLFDDNSDRHCVPFVNYTLIAINVFVFVVFQGLGRNDKFTYTWSTVPAEIISGQDKVTPDRKVVNPETHQYEVVLGLQPTPVSVYLTLLTSMFMHGSIAHIFGNMLFLYIFGDNVEDNLGHGRYLVFYLLCGILASLAHVFSTLFFAGSASPAMEIPSLGASGAISGVLGGYLLLFPQKRVTVLLGRVLTEVPAFVAIGMWFVFQIIAASSLLGGGGGGVAYGAHFGGFIAGMALVLPFMFGRDADGGRQRAIGRDWH
jgi:membrane associated rhomboid family serine protease